MASPGIPVSAAATILFTVREAALMLQHAHVTATARALADDGGWQCLSGSVATERAAMVAGALGRLDGSLQALERLADPAAASTAARGLLDLAEIE